MAGFRSRRALRTIYARWLLLLVCALAIVLADAAAPRAEAPGRAPPSAGVGAPVRPA